MSHSPKSKDMKAFTVSKKHKEMCSYNEYDTCGDGSEDRKEIG